MSFASNPSASPFGLLEDGWDHVSVLEARSVSFEVQYGWRPAVNAYRCRDRFVVFAELAGVAADALHIEAQPRQLILRGHRPAAGPAACGRESMQLLALEIDEGAFERVLELPQDIDPTRIAVEHVDGLVRIELPLAHDA